MINPKLKVGDKIVLVYMKGESGMTPGTKGVVTRIVKDPYADNELIISVDWDNERILSLVSTEDLWMLDDSSKKINENYNDLGEITFKKMWYSPEAADSVYFGDFDKNIDDILPSHKIRLVNDITDETYFFDGNVVKPTKNKDFLRVSMRDFQNTYKQEAEKLREKEDVKKTTNLNVIDLKKKTSGVPDTILKALKDVYPNNWGRINEPNCQTLDGVIDIFPAIQGERWSILNFFDTNPGVIKLLLEKYTDESEIQNLEGFKEWILNNKELLFGEDSTFLQSLIKRNTQSFERGWELESIVIDIIKREYPSIKSENITQYCLGSIKDRVSSIDVTINGKGYQIKPSTKMERLPNGEIKVYTHQMRDWYKNKKKDGLDYIIYSNGKNIAIFPNKNYSVSKDGKTVIHYSNIVKNAFSDTIMEQIKKDLLNDLKTQLTKEDVKYINETKYHWTEWRDIVDVLGKENKYIFDFFEELRKSGVINMLESTNFVFSGSDHLRRYIEFTKYNDYNEDDYEELYKSADLAKDAMIRITISYLEQEGKELTIENVNSAVKNLAKKALKSFIMIKSI